MIALSVLVAYLHPDVVSHSFMDSMARVTEHEFERGHPIFARFAIRTGPMTIVEGRNRAAQTLLEDTSCEWLWTVDSDMGFKDDILEQMLEFAHPDRVPVLGALCYGQFTGKADGMGGYYRNSAPTLYVKRKIPGGDTEGYVIPSPGFPEDQLLKVDATGAACMLIHRSVLTAIWDEYGEQWYSRITRPNATMAMGEDMSFCHRLGELGIPVHVHTGIPTTHHKSVFLGQ